MEYLEFIEKAKNIEIKYRVTTSVYKHFQHMCNDMNPLHTDIEFAKKKGFPKCVMYGNILNGFISYFVGMALPSPDVMIQTQDIQFRRPIYIGDSIILRSSVEKTSISVEIVCFKLKFYRTSNEIEELVATGHVQIGFLHDKA